MDDFGLVESVDCLGQRVVVAVALATDRGLNAGLGQSLAVANRDVLRTAIRMVDERAVALGLAGLEGLFKRIKHEIRMHATADPPAHDAASKDVDDEGDIDPALPSRDVGEV